MKPPRSRAATSGHDVVRGLNGIDRPVDALIFFQALEHTVDTRATLEAARSVLLPGGVVVIETWDWASRLARLAGMRWQQLSPPSVLHLFAGDGLTRLLQRSGFDPGTVCRATKRVNVGAMAGLLAGKSRLGATLLAPATHRPLSRLGFRYGLGDLVSVTARLRDE